jgi:indole-3-glycerol phosphate synthase
MKSQIPETCLLVGESGIKNRADALLLEQAGVDAMLVGESLMRQPDLGQAVDQLLGR